MTTCSYDVPCGPYVSMYPLMNNDLSNLHCKVNSRLYCKVYTWVHL